MTTVSPLRLRAPPRMRREDYIGRRRINRRNNTDIDAFADLFNQNNNNIIDDDNVINNYNNIINNIISTTIDDIDDNMDYNTDNNTDNNIIQNRLVRNYPPMLRRALATSFRYLERRFNNEMNQLQSQISDQHLEVNRLSQQVATLTENIDLLAESASPTALCAVCMTQPRNYANVSSGHLCACANCITQLGDQCPICRASGHFIRIVSS